MVIIDDIMTTGATLNAATLSLKKRALNKSGLYDLFNATLDLVTTDTKGMTEK